jgi:RNA polymerase sigma-70 factor (ECF subfamily)
MPDNSQPRPSADTPTDPELMLGVGEGDESAFETLIRRHEDRVFHLAYRIVGHRDEARDIAQDVFFAIWENPRAWKPTHLFTTWLYRVTVNRALNRRRVMKFKSYLSLSRSGGDDDDNDDVEMEVADESPDPEQLAIHRDEVGRLNRAFQQLPPRQRAALHLRYREGLPVKDVAQALGVSVKSAESLIFRGKRSVAKSCGETPESDGKNKKRNSAT